MPIYQMVGYFENPKYHMLEEYVVFLLTLKSNLKEKAFQNPAQMLL